MAKMSPPRIVDMIGAIVGGFVFAFKPVDPGEALDRGKQFADKLAERNPALLRYLDEIE